MCALASYDNVWVDLAAMCDLFLGEEYPFPGSLDMLNRFIDRYGDDKVIWGIGYSWFTEFRNSSQR